MNKIRSILLLATVLSAACVHMISHNQDLAASSAIKFLNLAFIDQNFLEASKKLPHAAQNAESAKQIEAFAKKLHPNGWPTSITAIEYEPMPSQKAMRIFLIGENNQEEKFYYMVVMQGTVDEGYGPSEIYRNPEPFSPSSAKKPLPIERSN